VTFVPQGFPLVMLLVRQIPAFSALDSGLCQNDEESAGMTGL
jgi:hypothetical protein